MTAVDRAAREGFDAWLRRVGLRRRPVARGPVDGDRAFAVDAAQQGERATVMVSGEVDISTAGRLREAIESHARMPGVHLLVDLTNATFMDSTGLGVLLAARGEIAARDGRLAIVCPQGPVRLLFEVSGVESELPLYDSLAALPADW